MDRLGDLRDRAFLRLDEQRDRITALEDAFKKLSSRVDQDAVRLGQMEIRVNETRISDITDRIAALEERIAPLSRATIEHSNKIKAQNSKISDLEGRARALERAAPPHDFPVTSTGAPKRARRFMVVKDHGMAFSREDGYVRRCAAANPACVPPMLFERLEDAGEIIRLLDLQDAEIEQVEAIERDGRLIEARYA